MVVLLKHCGCWHSCIMLQVTRPGQEGKKYRAVHCRKNGWENELQDISGLARGFWWMGEWIARYIGTRKRIPNSVSPYHNPVQLCVLPVTFSTSFLVYLRPAKTKMRSPTVFPCRYLGYKSITQSSSTPRDHENMTSWHCTSNSPASRWWMPRRRSWLTRSNSRHNGVPATDRGELTFSFSIHSLQTKCNNQKWPREDWPKFLGHSVCILESELKSLLCAMP